MLSILYTTQRPTITGWRYFWAMTVVGFNSRVHCASCLVGQYHRDIGPKMQVNTPIPVDIPENGIFYICGVASPYSWANNFHLALRVKPGVRCSLPTYNGDTVTADGAEQIPILPDDAAQLFPTRDRHFLTCRNFQFGVSIASTLSKARRASHG